jgi:hypothetical protein
MAAPLADLLGKSQPQKIVITPTCMELFETRKLRLISAPCLVLPEVSSDATFTVAIGVSAVGIACALVQDHGGGLPAVS